MANGDELFAHRDTPSRIRHPLSPDEAMKNIETLLTLPHARLLSEGEGFWDVYRATTSEVPTREIWCQMPICLLYCATMA